MGVTDVMWERLGVGTVELMVGILDTVHVSS
jgi:hypothetical protein